MQRFLVSLAAVGALLLVSGAAMMPAGPSPESGLAGMWRVIGAKPAPWSKPRKLTGADAPLLEFALGFEDGAVKGPAPLGCDHATYSSGVSYQDDLFGGRFAKDASGAMAKAVDLDTSSPTTFRVICGASVRDFYVDKDSNLIVAEGDVIYTLARPSGMDVAQMAPGFSGPSFDCTKAKTAADQMLCSDAGVARNDREMAQAYARLKRTETPQSFASVQAAQRAWLAYVLKSCHGSGPMPEDQGAKNDLQGCLGDAYGDRADRLKNIAVATSGALILEPRMRYFTRAKPDTEDSDIYPWMSGGPQAQAFNAWIAKSLALSKRRIDDKDLFAFTPDQIGDLKLSARRTYTVYRFDDRIVSFETYVDDYTGGAHEVLSEKQFNWDMRKAAPIAPGDVFVKDWKAAVTDYCLADLRKQFGEARGAAGEEGLKRADVAAVVDSGAFLFGTKSLRVHFTVYTITSFAGGEYDVDIPYKVLKPYARVDAPFL